MKYVKSAIKKAISANYMRIALNLHKYRFNKYAYTDGKCTLYPQFEASIIRLYHTIEKGLSYQNYRPGFGKANVEKLVTTLEQYAKRGFDCESFAYRTGLSCLYTYISKNKEYGLEDLALDERVKALPGDANECGGTISVSAPINPNELNYEQLVTSRHSIRFFSNIPVDQERLIKAVKLAQYTPSACNRQGWLTRIICDKEKIDCILNNQNGNQGFGQRIDKLLVITADLCTQQKSREFFQAYIDGGMYAESVLNSLYYLGIGAIPLSASLTPSQERNVRQTVGLSNSEVLILFIGVGNYPDGEVTTTRSERKPAKITII